MFKLSGIMPALLTPFDDEGNVNLSVLRDLIEYHLAAGVSGFYILGSTGEGLLLSNAERQLVAQTVIDQVRGRAPVVVHVGALTTRTAQNLAAHAEKAGADAISSIPPIYYPVGVEGVKQHYLEIAAASKLPFYIYNIPGITGVNVTVDMIKDLLPNMPTLRGIKYTDYDFRRLRHIIELEGGRLNVMSGPDEMMISALAMGADGAIGTTENVLPHVCIQLYRAFRGGNMATAQELQAKIIRVVDLFLQLPSLSAVKEMMCLLGFNCGPARRPILPLTGEQKGQLREQLEAIGFFQFAQSRGD